MKMNKLKKHGNDWVVGWGSGIAGLH